MVFKQGKLWKALFTIFINIVAFVGIYNLIFLYSKNENKYMVKCYYYNTVARLCVVEYWDGKKWKYKGEFLRKIK